MAPSVHQRTTGTAAWIIAPIRGAHTPQVRIGQVNVIVEAPVVPRPHLKSPDGQFIESALLGFVIMPVPASSLSIVCTSIGDFVRAGINAAANNIVVTIGAPASVAGEDDEQRINLFFYRFEPYGFNADGRPDEIWRLRLFCLVTTFGVDEDDVPAGENDCGCSAK